ncbi:MAG: UDP-N-acetylenolpyruvoylglucosamine reductase, partial [Opitutus sp.]
PGASAGRLIDESGLKGERVGDAEVSPVHANFIVNRGKATGSDVLELVRRIRARVREVKGVDLEPEVLLYGKNWKDVL